MKKIEISEIQARALKAELQELEEKIREARGEHGDAAQEEGGLFRNPASHTIAQDIIRWSREKERIKDVLSSAEIIKINKESDEMTAEVGDIVSAQMTYEGEEPEEMKFQIDGLYKISGVVNVTFASPMGKALRGKKIGEKIMLRKSQGSPTEADGVILGIVKAKDLETTIGEVDSKKPYTLKTHS